MIKVFYYFSLVIVINIGCRNQAVPTNDKLLSTDYGKSTIERLEKNPNDISAIEDFMTLCLTDGFFEEGLEYIKKNEAPKEFMIYKICFLHCSGDKEEAKQLLAKNEVFLEKEAINNYNAVFYLQTMLFLYVEFEQKEKGFRLIEKYGDKFQELKMMKQSYKEDYDVLSFNFCDVAQ
jgi:hypothetical protein